MNFSGGSFGSARSVAIARATDFGYPLVLPVIGWSLRTDCVTYGGRFAAVLAVQTLASILLAAAAADAVLAAAVDSGANDARSDEDTHRILCAHESLADVARTLEELIGLRRFGVKLVWSPKYTVTVEEGSADTIQWLSDSLNDDDDVQVVYSNFDLPVPR